MTNVDKVKTSDHDISHGDMKVQRVTQQYTATGQKSQFLLFCVTKTKTYIKAKKKPSEQH